MAGIVFFTLATAAWAAGVAFFWRARAWLPCYVLAAVGSALLLVVFSRELSPVESWIRAATAHSVYVASPLLGIRTTLDHVDSGSLMIIGVPHHAEWTVLTVGLESSGLLEMAALFGLVAFFPAQPLPRRALTVVVALAFTFVANILRVLIIVATVAYLGDAYLDFAHIVVGRLVFFVIAIGIFWFAVTRPSLRRVHARLEAPA